MASLENTVISYQLPVVSRRLSVIFIIVAVPEAESVSSENRQICKSANGKYYIFIIVAAEGIGTVTLP